LVDIHSHILHGIDDGAKTLEDSIAMLKMASGAGTTDLAATPHANQKYRFDPQIIRERLRELESAAGGAVRLHTGCDFHLSYENIEDAIANPRKYTLNQNRYLLVEFSDLLIFRNTAEIFERLQESGMAPVITHPERNGLLRQRIEEIARWVEAGAYVQVTAQSITGHFGRKAAEFSEALIARGLVHFIASDAHDLVHRPPKMDEAYSALAHRYGKEFAEIVCVVNPKAALTGEAIELPGSGAPARKWFQIWR
jgi:protein-tyrosine phosphatase